MKQTVTDKLISKFSKNKINTIRVTRDEMADMIDQYFIQKAVTEEEYQAIWKVVKRGLFFDKYLLSKDEKYELHSQSSQAGRSLRRFVWIHAKEENVFYEYNYWVGFYGKFKKIMRRKLDQARK